MTGLLALTASAASSRAQNVAGANPLGKSGSLSRDLAYALAIQRDGRLVVAGRSAYGGWRFALARYTAGGKLDPSFGGDGKVVTAFGSRGYSWTSALAIQRDGKLVAAGRSRVTALSDDSAVGRYSARGRLDSSFGRGGKVLTDFGSRKRVSGWANAVAIQADGKLVVAGSSGIIADGPWRFALSRYTARGKLDPTFGSGGKVLTRFGPVSDSAVAVAIQRDGKIVAAGSDVRNHAVFALARYTPGGKLDPSFGSGGKVLTDLGLWSDARAVAIQADGKLVVAGVGRLSDFAVARYAADGKLDPSFGSGGKVVTNFGFIGDCAVDCSESEEGANAVAIQADGKLLVAGSSNARGEYGEKVCCITDFALVRYNADGSLDVSFGRGGKVLTHFVGGSGVAGIGIQADGKIVAAGGGAGYFALTRYTALGKLDSSFGSGGKVMTNFRTG